MLECAEDLCDARLAGVGCHEDSFDVFGFGGRELDMSALESNDSVTAESAELTLSLVAPFTDFSKPVIVLGAAGQRPHSILQLRSGQGD